jgi:hypothetical protein
MTVAGLEACLLAVHCASCAYAGGRLDTKRVRKTVLVCLRLNMYNCVAVHCAGNFP